MLTPTQIARLLALHIGWRRRLAAMPGPGWWYKPNGFAWSNDGHLVCDCAGVDVKTGIADGWAWAPCDPMAWARACGMVTWHGTTDSAAMINDCLLWMETNAPPEVRDA